MEQLFCPSVCLSGDVKEVQERSRIACSIFVLGFAVALVMGNSRSMSIRGSNGRLKGGVLACCTGDDQTVTDAEGKSNTLGQTVDRRSDSVLGSDRMSGIGVSCGNSPIPSQLLPSLQLLDEAVVSDSVQEGSTPRSRWVTRDLSACTVMSVSFPNVIRERDQLSAEFIRMDSDKSEDFPNENFWVGAIHVQMSVTQSCDKHFVQTPADRPEEFSGNEDRSVVSFRMN